MKYDFDEQISRRGTNSYKWDSAEDSEILPMWVADMDFKTAPSIIESLQKRVSHGIFGYTRVPDSYYSSVTSWFRRRHGFNIEKEWIIYTSGVVPAISAVIKALTSPGDKVLVQTPVYNCFFSSIRNNGCEIVSSPLVYENDTFSIDYEDFERKVSDRGVKVFLLCNPHNPACRVWTLEELKRLGEICLKYGVKIVSDEIHCELVFDGHKYIPFASISQEFLHNSITCVSPSKAFNIAGLQIANIVCEDSSIRSKIDRAINDNEVCDVNPFGVIATEAAYNDGEDWLSQLIEYIYQNYQYMQEYCTNNLPEFPIVKLEGTYLAFMNCSVLGISSSLLEEKLKAEVKLWLNAGTMYGPEGKDFIRWNLACPRKSLEEGLNRFNSYVKRHKK